MRPKAGDKFRFFKPVAKHDVTTPVCLCLFIDELGILYENLEWPHVGERRYIPHPKYEDYRKVRA